MKNTVYFIGAGFSRFAGLPLMNDFYFKSKDLFPKLKNESIKKAFLSVFSYFDDYSKVKNIMNADFYNIEELLSIIEMDSFLKNKRAIYKNYLIYLEEVIKHYTPKFEDEDDEVFDIYSQFLEYVFNISRTSRDNRYKIFNENGSSIISLNYDLILELTLEEMNLYNRSKGYGLNNFSFNYGISNNYLEENYRSINSEFTLNYAKIHGSINFQLNRSPIIIPPTWNKTSSKEMKGVWQFAHQLLAQTENIVFIGYSLPTTDLYVKYLLINGIKDSFNLKQVKVICPDFDGSIEKRYKTFFDANFRDKAFSFENIKFEDWIRKTNKKENRNRVTVRSFSY